MEARQEKLRDYHKRRLEYYKKRAMMPIKDSE